MTVCCTTLYIVDRQTKTKSTFGSAWMQINSSPPPLMHQLSRCKGVWFGKLWTQVTLQNSNFEMHAPKNSHTNSTMLKKDCWQRGNTHSNFWMLFCCKDSTFGKMCSTWQLSDTLLHMFSHGAHVAKRAVFVAKVQTETGHSLSHTSRNDPRNPPFVNDRQPVWCACKVMHTWVQNLFICEICFPMLFNC